MHWNSSTPQGYFLWNSKQKSNFNGIQSRSELHTINGYDLLCYLQSFFHEQETDCYQSNCFIFVLDTQVFSQNLRIEISKISSKIVWLVKRYNNDNLYTCVRSLLWRSKIKSKALNRLLINNHSAQFETRWV